MVGHTVTEDDSILLTEGIDVFCPTAEAFAARLTKKTKQKFR